MKTSLIASLVAGMSFLSSLKPLRRRFEMAFTG